jgi:hypothetical protein
MLGLAYLRADTCKCGRSLTETTASDVDERSWHVTKHTCTACEMLAIRQKAEAGDYPTAELWTVERVATQP